MSNTSIILSGMYPRSEALIEATRSHDRKRITSDKLNEILSNQQKDLIEFQKKLGVSLYSDGLLNWQDHFRPFSEIFTGLEPGTLTRFTNTNTFFRKPRVISDIKYNGNHADYFSGTKLSGDWVAILPAPFYFTRLAEDDHFKSPEKVIKSFTQALNELIKDLAKNNYKSFILLDPYLGYLDTNKEELEIIYNSIQEIISNSNEKIGYHVAYSCSNDTIKMLLKTNLELIGIDFFKTDIEAIPSFESKKTLLAGCLDSRTSLIEDTKIISKFINSAQDKINPSNIIATSNIDLQFVPVSIAEKKLHSLKNALN